MPDLTTEVQAFSMMSNRFLLPYHHFLAVDDVDTLFKFIQIFSIFCIHHIYALHCEDMVTTLGISRYTIYPGIFSVIAK